MNKHLGTLFEKELAKYLDEEGFWVHLLVQNANGQPADMIAVRNHKTYLIDAKVCSSVGFPLSRVEENQELAMTKFNIRNQDNNSWFALKFKDGIYMVDLSDMLYFKKEKGLSRLPLSTIKRSCYTLREWVNCH